MKDDGLNWDDVLEEASKRVAGGETPPHPLPSRIAFWIIDETTNPTLYCKNNHVIEWQNSDTGIKMAAIYRFGEKHVGAVCIVCGDEVVVERAEDSNGETPAADSC